METGKIAEDARSWYLAYLGVQPDVLASLPIAFTNDEVVFRFPGIDKSKVRKKGERGAIWRGQGHTPDLWPLPGRTVGEDIVITEGESDCIVARALGFEAYSITKGAAAGLSAAVLIALRRRGARRVVVAMDADSAGRQAATKMVIAARQAGLAAIDLDLVAEGLIEPLLGHKDIRDAFKYGKGQDLVEAITHLLYQADEPRPSQPRKLADIMSEERPTDFVIEGLVRIGGSTILVGEPKLGKSQMSLDMALAVARGEAFCGLATKKGRVIYYALEDGEDIVRDRVRMRGLSGLEEDVYIGTTPPVVEDNVAILEEHIDTIQPTLVIIDTLRAISVSGGKSENEASFADAIYRIAKLARERGVATLIVHHTVKATSGNPISDVRGTSAIAGAVDVVAGLYRRDDIMRLAWRGRFGTGDMVVTQHPNGSFNYPPSVAPTNMANEEYTRRVEERLAKYYEACRKYADKQGRVDVKKVVIAIWGLKEGRYIEGSWNKTYKALDELVRRQKLRKRERQYYIVHEEQFAYPDTASHPKENGVQTQIQECIEEHTQGASPVVIASHIEEDAQLEGDKEEVSPQDVEGEDSQCGVEAKDEDEIPEQQANWAAVLDALSAGEVIRVADIPKQLSGYIDWAAMEHPGKLTSKVIEAGRSAVGLIAGGRYEEVDKLLEPVRSELSEAYNSWWVKNDEDGDLDRAIELLCKIMLAKMVAYLATEGGENASLVLFATKMWRDVLHGRITSDQALWKVRAGESMELEWLPRIYDLSEPAELARSLRLLRINLPRI
jgi:5S rRNA maturation endonuclease (ribonuclease M5)